MYGRSSACLMDGHTDKERNDALKQTPNLIPYEQLTETEKEYDRKMVILTFKAILALGYRIEKH